ncbi:MAG: OB-fold nucleic acid binding domain-containing protein, partial [Ginsengibacter sp.]
MSVASILKNPIEYLKGVGPQRADLLKKEAGIFTFEDLLNYFPYRHIDRTKVTRIGDIHMETDYVLVFGKIISVEELGEKRSRRLVASMSDGSGIMELVWFQGINWVNKLLHIGTPMRVFGKVGFFMNSPQMAHPEFELISSETTATRDFLEPVYPSTEKLKARQLGGRNIAQLTFTLLQLLSEKDIPENLPETLKTKYKLAGRFESYKNIHFPANLNEWQEAVNRLKFEELFISQLRLGLIRFQRNSFSKGLVFEKSGDFLNDFYHHHLPFELTNAQKRVLKEIRKDLGSGKQMNRLLQGDVGSGKTMVAL